MSTSRLQRVSALCLAAMVGAATAESEIVVLDNGRFLKAEGYEVRGENASIGLANGGELILSLDRIERVIDDEMARPGPLLAVPRAEPVGSLGYLYLGFEPGRPVPETPYGDVIYEAGSRRNVNPDLIAAIIRAESAFDPQAVSNKGARGLMQLMPATGKQLGLDAGEFFDPELNIDAGVAYLGQLIETYAEDLPVILAAYNAGEGAVARHNGVPPFRETREYIRRVYSLLGMDVESEPGK